MKTNFFNITKRITKGIQKGWSRLRPTLPTTIANFHNHLITRIFRIIGGLSLMFTLGRFSLLNKDIPIYIIYASNFISLLFSIYMFVINIFRLIHIFKVLRSDDLNIRNTPLDK